MSLSLTYAYISFLFSAVKCLNNLNLDARQRKFQAREIALHHLVSSHTGIVSLNKVITTPSLVYVVLDYCEGGDLFSLITEKQRYLNDDALITNVFLQICDAVEHCHKNRVFHRDLKPENILCRHDGTKVLLADFGLASTDERTADWGVGSTFYMSPQTHGGITEPLDNYDSAPNDVWSLGVIVRFVTLWSSQALCFMVYD